MELLALVLVNIVFGIVLYYVISIKLTNSMRDYQNQKLKKEIQAHTLDFFKESENYLALMDSRISILKNLIKKAENMGIDFKEMHIREELDKIEEFQKKSQVPLPNIKEEKPVKNPLPAKENPTVFQKEKITNSLKEEQSPSEGGLLASLGKAFKSMMGVESGEEIETPKVTSQAQVKIQKKNLDFSVGGNPFEDSTKIMDNNVDENSFQGILSNVKKPFTPKSPEDNIKISISTAIKEIPEDTGKVDKVVFLLKKGYSHTEISEELGLAIPEISLIETIKLERNRRI